MPTNYTKIRTLADQRGITVSRLCTMTGKHRTYLGAMQRQGGELPEEALYSIAQALGTSTDYLADITDDPDPNYLLRQTESPEERLLHLVMQKLPEMTDGQVAALNRLFALDKCDFDKMIAALEVWGK